MPFQWISKLNHLVSVEGGFPWANAKLQCLDAGRVGELEEIRCGGFGRSGERGGGEGWNGGGDECRERESSSSGWRNCRKERIMGFERHEMEGGLERNAWAADWRQWLNCHLPYPKHFTIALFFLLYFSFANRKINKTAHLMNDNWGHNGKDEIGLSIKVQWYLL